MMAMDLDTLRKRIENFDKPRQIEVLRIFVKHNINVNENKNGIFVNLSSMEPNVITDLQDFMNHIDNQENTLQSREQSFAASATFIDGALWVPAVIICEYRLSTSSAILGVDPEVIFFIDVTLCSLSPGFILSGL